MVETGSYSEEKLREIGEYAKTAIEVFNFIVSLPTPLGEFVFRQIVEDAYSIAGTQSPDIVKQHLLKAICNSIQSLQSIDPICKYLGVINYYKEVDNLIMESEALFTKLQEICKFENLPPMDGLVHSYSCFSMPNVDCNYDNTCELIRVHIMGSSELFEKDNTLSTIELDSCFIRLCYQTIFEKVVSNRSSLQEDFLFHNWYCKGELIDSVLDTIFKCGVTSISHSLWAILVRKCEQNYYLSKVVQERYNYYRLFSPSIAYHTFEYKGEQKHEPVIPIVSLPCIPISKEDKNSISDECMVKLYNKLYGRELDCSFQEFKSAFSGERQTTRPIHWLKKQKELASFLYVLHGKGEVDKEYSEKASKIFVQKNGKQCSATTLNQPDIGGYTKVYKKLFISVGINR